MIPKNYELSVMRIYDTDAWRKIVCAAVEEEGGYDLAAARLGCTVHTVWRWYCLEIKKGRVRRYPTRHAPHHDKYRHTVEDLPTVPLTDGDRHRQYLAGLAGHYGVAIQTIQKWIRLGKLPAGP